MNSLIVNCIFLSQRPSGIFRVGVELSRLIKQNYPETIFVSPRDILHEEIAFELGVKKIGSFSGLLWEQTELPFFCLTKAKGSVLINLTNTAPIFHFNKISMLYDIFFLKYPELMSKRYFWYYRILLPIVIRTSLKVVTISEFSKNEIISFFNLNKKLKNKILVNHIGVHEKVRSRNEISKNIFAEYILFVSAIEPRKNLHRLINAFKALPNCGIKLVIAGSVKGKINIDYLEKIRNENRLDIENGTIIFLGPVSEHQLESLYANALMFVYPSLYEGFGLPPLEAMCFGCPVIVSNSTSLPEVCGDAALYVDPKSEESISMAIKKLLESVDLRKSFVEKGARRIKMFNWTMAGNKWFSIFKNYNV